MRCVKILDHVLLLFLDKGCYIIFYGRDCAEIKFLLKHFEHIRCEECRECWACMNIFDANPVPLAVS